MGLVVLSHCFEVSGPMKVLHVDVYDKVSHVDVYDGELWVYANVIDKEKVLHVDVYDECMQM